MDIVFFAFVLFGVLAYLMHQGHCALRRYQVARKLAARAAHHSRVQLDIQACQRQLDTLTAKAIKGSLPKAESDRMRALLKQEAALRDISDATYA